MIIESGYLGYLKYDGDAVEEGIMDARDSASALLGFDEAFRYFVQQEKPAWGKEDLNLPVRIEKGCWQILIPAGIAFFAGYYLKAAAEKAGHDGLFEIGAARDLDRILKAALVSLKWIVKISKHVGAVGDQEKLKDARALDVDHVEIPGTEGTLMVVPVKYFEMYSKCPSGLLGQCAQIIDEGRELEIGSFENNKVIDPVRIYPEERLIFYRDQDEEAEVVFPDLKHGDPVALDGEITRATESTNTLGLRYQGHTLFCRPDDGRRIAFFKQRIISQQEDHIFPKVKMIGVVNREDKHGGFKAKKPEILFSDIQRRESISGSLF